MIPRALTFGLVVSFAAFPSCLIASANASRPNILLILADDLGYSDLGCYGSEIRTPALNALAKDGLRFTQFYNATRCCPSRASLLTGLYPHQAGVGAMGTDHGEKFPGYRGFLQPHTITLAEALKVAGYRTYMVGKWHQTSHVPPTARGFDEFYGFLGGIASYWSEKSYVRLPAGRGRRPYSPESFYSTDAFADYALDFVAEARGTPERPWFLYLSFNAPHFPLQAPRSDTDRYAALYARGWDAIREERLARLKELKLVATDCRVPPRSDFENYHSGEKGPNPAWDSLPVARRADLARRMAIYAAMVERMDQAIGRIVANLRAHGELDNTLVLFLSDNGACAEWDWRGFDISSDGDPSILHEGETLQQMGLRGSYHSTGSGWAEASNTPWRLYKHYTHEGGISTPLIVHWPAGTRRKNEVDSRVGHIIDLMPTLLEAASATYPQIYRGQIILPLEGQSLLPALRGASTGPRTLCWEHEGNRAIRVGDWKLVAREDQRWELYDVGRDRTESVDLADKFPERLRELATQWERWADRVFVRPPPGKVDRG